MSSRIVAPIDRWLSTCLSSELFVNKARSAGVSLAAYVAISILPFLLVRLASTEAPPNLFSWRTLRGGVTSTCFT